MLWKLIILVALMMISGCSQAFPTPPSRFPQLKETIVAGPGNYLLPQWSPDGRYLAFIENTTTQTQLLIYDTVSREKQVVAKDLKATYFDWDPNNRLTYLKYRPEISGSPYPSFSDLHLVDITGNDDQILASTLSGVGNFAWFRNGEKMVILLAPTDLRTSCQDTFLLDKRTGDYSLIVSAKDVNLDCLTRIDLSFDNEDLLIYGFRNINALRETFFVVYNLKLQDITQEFFPNEIIPIDGTSESKPSIGDDTNSGWIGNSHWVITTVNSPEGQCYNYSIFFIDLQNLSNSFCLPTVEGIVAEPAINPDLLQIAYISHVRPGKDFLVTGEITMEIRSQLRTNEN